MIDKIFIKDFNVVTFNDGSENYQQLEGYAFSKDSKINLDKIFEYNEYSLDEAEFSNIDYLQRDTTEYFCTNATTLNKEKLITFIHS